MFSLDPRLAADTIALGRLSLSRVLLMNDVRFPWLILVPEREGMREIIDLPESDQAILMSEIAAASRALRAIATPDKINVGALGNIVGQLHVHVVARRAGDAAWPGPVWGAGTASPYDAAARDRRTAELAAALAGHLRELG
jgi:diadenosine tetraphosphate (Ap4A) HIT family hydrolase